MQIDLKNNLVINIILWLQISLIISGKNFNIVCIHRTILLYSV